MKKLIIRLINYLKIKKNHINIGDRTTIRGIIKACGNVKIGNNCIINSNIIYNAIGGDSGCVFIANDLGRIIIGNNVGISNSTIRSFESIIIEDNVMIGGSCKIYDTDFHSINYEDRIINNNINIKTSPVVIKEGAWIGGHSIILKGVTIGKHSVIGAGSVVTKSVPDNEVWAGNPAKFIKKIGD